MIAKTEFFRRQSVMSFADRREQLLAEAGRWVKGGMCKVKKKRPYVGNPAIDRTNSLGGW
jgi:hypothetical protein